jgi:hypothetical protein
VLQVLNPAVYNAGRTKTFIAIANAFAQWTEVESAVKME